ncbi:MAG: lipopolysaccharide heptosyltransferase II, partial [Thermodesulfobacteriota bacterium]
DQRLRGLGLSGAFLVGIAPGAAYGPAKEWPADRFAAAADLILDENPGAALIFGSASEAAAAGRVAAVMRRRAVDLAGRTNLAEAAALIARCTLFLTNDSGLMHLAAAVDTPLVAVFGSTNPVTTSPTGRRQRLVRKPVECAPCLKTHCDRPRQVCMDLITPGEVAAAALELLSREGEVNA